MTATSGGEMSITGRGAGGRERRGETPMVPPATPTSYYGQPVIKPPVWEPDIGVYLFTGGLAAGSGMLAAAARRSGNDALARRGTLLAVAGASISPVLLIRDLGRPARFHHMLRVFKVTSPMNMGTWILSGFGTACGVAAACEVLGILPRLRNRAEVAMAMIAPALATYTAVLLADTAVPTWHEARRELPFLFAAGAAGSAGAAATMLTPVAASRPARRLCVGGAVAELVAAELMQRRLGELGRPYHEGAPGGYARAAKALTAGGAALLAVAGRWRVAALAGGAAVLTGAMCTRWSVFRAGFASAEDPAYTVQPQRLRVGRAVSGAGPMLSAGSTTDLSDVESGPGAPGRAR